MARDQEPMTEDAIEDLTEDIQELREEVREDLAADLGGNPEDYNAERYFANQADEPVADGGDAE